METVVIIVPKDKDTWSFIVEKVKLAKGSWMFLHKNVLEELKPSASHHEFKEDNGYYLLWEDYSSRELITGTGIGIGAIWFPVKMIIDNKIDFFWKSPADPEGIFFLKMEE